MNWIPEPTQPAAVHYRSSAEWPEFTYGVVGVPVAGLDATAFTHPPSQRVFLQLRIWAVPCLCCWFPASAGPVWVVLLSWPHVGPLLGVWANSRWMVSLVYAHIEMLFSSLLSCG